MAELGQAEIMTAAVTECAPDWSWDSKLSPWRHLILWMVTAGKGTMNHAGQVYPVQAGDCFVFRMWHRCVGRHDPKTPLTVYWCEFRFLDTKGKPLTLSDAVGARLPVVHRRPPDLPFLTQVFDRAIRYSHESGRHNEANLWMEATLQELARQDALLPRSGLELEHYEAIRDITAAIRREPGRAWSVRELSKQLHYTPDHFSRLFRAVRGESPREFLIRTRIEEAKHLISMSSHSIGRIADLLGYSDVYHFSKQFKEKTGIPPSRFRSR
jgi:AraC-like DNA-binding protein